MSPAPPLALIACTSVPAALLAARLAGAYAPAPHGGRVSLAAVPVMMVIFAWAALATPWGPILLASLVLGWALACLALIDAIAYRLPDAFTWPLTAIGLAVSVLLPGRPILDHLVGAAIGWGLLTAIAWAYHRLRGREGLGAGDAKLLAVAGAWLGWGPLPSVILIACAAAFVWIAIRTIVGGRQALADRVAFGPPLCLAILFVWLQGPLAV